MNIFYLDRDPKICARYHNDRHCVKMIVESCQLLSNALPEDQAPYKRTHYNHPCSIWARQSLANWLWLCELTVALLEEWTERFNHSHPTEHACTKKLLEMKLKMLHDRYGIHDFDLAPFTPPPQCMPDDCKCEDTVQAYRNYYTKHKQHIAQWKNGQPDWYV